MSDKPFIHPTIVINIKSSLETDISDTQEKALPVQPKDSGKSFAEDILRNLFPQRNEYGEIKSHFNTERLNSERFSDVRDKVISIYYQRKTFEEKLSELERQKEDIVLKLTKLERSFLKMFYKKRIIRFTEDLSAAASDISNVEDVKSESFIELTYEFNIPNLRECYSDFHSSFITLKASHTIWDVLTNELNLETKSSAHSTVTRKEVRFDLKGLAIIETNEHYFHIENSNGGDFYFYPNFIVYYKSAEEVAIIGYDDLYLIYSVQRFLEEKDSLPPDAKVIGETWDRVNKDGSPDRRFASNRRIPIVQYGALHFKTANGINELFYVSDKDKAEHFSQQFSRYQSALRGKGV